MYKVIEVSFKLHLRQPDPSHAPHRTDAKQEYERLGLGTPPALLRQNSLGRPPSSSGRHTDDEGSLRRRAVKVGTEIIMKHCCSQYATTNQQAE